MQTTCFARFLVEKFRKDLWVKLPDDINYLFENPQSGEFSS